LSKAESTCVRLALPCCGRVRKTLSSKPCDAAARHLNFAETVLSSSSSSYPARSFQYESIRDTPLLAAAGRI
jgi:hypothetical protein